MLRKHITDHYSVSEQIDLDDVETLSQSGVTLIVCNRPDNEEEGQLPFADIEAAAKAKKHERGAHSVRGWTAATYGCRRVQKRHRGQ